MKVYILFILFFNYIASIEIPGNFNIYNPLSSYITPENDMVIYNPQNKTLFKYKHNSKSPFYTNMSTLNTKEFPKDSSINKGSFWCPHLTKQRFFIERVIIPIRNFSRYI